MRHFRCLGLLSLLALFSIPPAFAQTGAEYYVARSNLSASDSNPGTASLPWKTIRHAADVVTAGATVYVKAGTYLENSANASWNTAVLSPVNSGTAAKPIIFKRFGTDSVIITSPSYGTPAIGTNSLDYVHWEGFVTDRPITIFDSVGTELGFLDVIGQHIDNSANDNHDGIRIERTDNARIHHCKIHGVTADGGAFWNSAGIKVYGKGHSNLLVEDNWIYGNQAGVFDKDTGINNTYRRNYFVGNDFVGNNQGENATFFIYDNVFEGSYPHLYWLNDKSQVHDNLIRSSSNSVATSTTSTDAVTNIEVWNNIVEASTGAVFYAWWQYWTRTGHELVYFDNNIYTSTPTYRFNSEFNLSQVRSFGYESHSSVASSLTQVYDGNWNLKAPFLTSGRYADAPGPGNGSEGLISQIRDTARYGPGSGVSPTPTPSPSPTPTGSPSPTPSPSPTLTPTPLPTTTPTPLDKLPPEAPKNLRPQ